MPDMRLLHSFIELAPFVRASEAYGMDDGEFAELQLALAAAPESGGVIPGSGGCRKFRWRAGTRQAWQLPGDPLPSRYRGFDCPGVACTPRTCVTTWIRNC